MINVLRAKAVMPDAVSAAMVVEMAKLAIHV
jgi:hypothetical protein